MGAHKLFQYPRLNDIYDSKWSSGVLCGLLEQKHIKTSRLNNKRGYKRTPLNSDGGIALHMDAITYSSKPCNASKINGGTESG